MRATKPKQATAMMNFMVLGVQGVWVLVTGCVLD